jgi:hypothetical protein
MIESCYRRLSYAETAELYDETYDVLVGPDGFECMLGEREDRTWCRDGRQAVDRLNSQHREIERLRDALNRAERLLSICEFSAPEDLADLEFIAKAMED